MAVNGPLGSNVPRIHDTAASSKAAAPKGKANIAKAALPKAKAGAGTSKLGGSKAKASFEPFAKSKASSPKVAGGKVSQLDVQMSDSDTAAIFWEGQGDAKAGDLAKAPKGKGNWADPYIAKGKGSVDFGKGSVDLGKGDDPYSEANQVGAFLKSNYSYDDALQAKAVFDFLDTVSDAKSYIGLKVINGREAKLADMGITPMPFDAHEEQSAFLQSDYSYDDAVQAKAAFDFLDTVSDAKAYIGLKVINGTESILGEVGVTPSFSKAKGKGAASFDDIVAASAGWAGDE